MDITVENLINDLVKEDRKDRWMIIVAGIVRRFGEKAVNNIIEAIKADPLSESRDGIVSTKNSPKWNLLALTFQQVGYVNGAVKIFQELISCEPNNPASQNNYGVVLLRNGRLGEAIELFKKAYETDKRLKGIKLAKKAPAYQNLERFKGIRQFKAKEKLESGKADIGPEVHYNILFMDIVGFSRPSWSGIIEVDKISTLIDIVRSLLLKFGYRIEEVPMLHTGDGMVLFLQKCKGIIDFAIDLTKQLDDYNKSMESDMKLEVRIGIHNGFSFPVRDLYGRENRCGPAINIARRVMDLGKEKHILCTEDFVKDLKETYGSSYNSMLHNCGKYKVKHGEEIIVYNIFNESFGNKDCPEKEAGNIFILAPVPANIKAGDSITLNFNNVTFSSGQFYLLWSSDGFSQISSGDFKYTPTFATAKLHSVTSTNVSGTDAYLGTWKIGNNLLSGPIPKHVRSGTYFIKLYCGKTTPVAVSSAIVVV